MSLFLSPVTPEIAALLNLVYRVPDKWHYDGYDWFTYGDLGIKDTASMVRTGEGSEHLNLYLKYRERRQAKKAVEFLFAYRAQRRLTRSLNSITAEMARMEQNAD
jgi:hypothetical protein